MSKLKLGILGSGFLGGIIARSWKSGLLQDYELVGIEGRNEKKTFELSREVGCRPCKDIEELLSLKPDYIAEAASIGAVKDNALKILSKGVNLVLLSIGALADGEFYNEVKKVAKEHCSKVYIASGAVGGFDVLRTISLMGEAKSKFSTQKSSQALGRIPMFKKIMEKNGEATEVFSGNAKQAIEILPCGVNVAVATALASTGPEKTDVSINSVPDFIGDDHTLICETEGVKAVVDIYSDTSAIAGFSVVATLRNIVSPIVF